MRAAFFFIFFLSLFLSSGTAYCEVESFFSSEKEQILEYSDIIRDTSGVSYKGTVFANVVSVDPQYRFIFIKPKEFDLPRMYVYLDPLTRYTYSKVGFKKRSSVKRLLEGDRVAVRVFTKFGVIVADEVFYVEGDYEAPSKYERKVYEKAAVPQSVPAASHGKKEGGH